MGFFNNNNSNNKNDDFYNPEILNRRMELSKIAREALINNDIYINNYFKWDSKKEDLKIILNKEYDEFDSMIKLNGSMLIHDLQRQYIVTSLNYIPGYNIVKTLGLYKISSFNAPCCDIDIENNPFNILNTIQLYNNLKSKNANAIINCKYFDNMLYGDIVIIEKVEENNG